MESARRPRTRAATARELRRSATVWTLPIVMYFRGRSRLASRSERGASLAPRSLILVPTRAAPLTRPPEAEPQRPSRSTGRIPCAMPRDICAYGHTCIARRGSSRSSRSWAAAAEPAWRTAPTDASALACAASFGPPLGAVERLEELEELVRLRLESRAGGPLPPAGGLGNGGCTPRASRRLGAPRLYRGARLPCPLLARSDGSA